MILVAGSIATQTVAGHEDDVSAVLMLLGQIVFASVPFTFLAGLLRDRVARADAVGALLVRLGEAPGTDGLRGLLAEALNDPRLKVLYWVEGCWVKRDGQPGRDPRATARGRRSSSRASAWARSCTTAACAREPEVLNTVAAAAGLAMRSERLEAALRRSRARIVEAGLQERRRLERNLHDGAQQRLVALSLTLRIAQNQIAKDAREGGGDDRRGGGGAHARARRSCASSPAASTRPCSPIAACRPPSRRSPCAPRCRSRSSRSRASACPSRSRPRPTS